MPIEFARILLNDDPDAGGGGDTTTAVADGGGDATPADPGTPASWRDALPDDLKSAKSLSKFNDVAALSKSYMELEAKVGANTIKRPGENATAEEREAFYQQLGRPEKPEDYQLPSEGLAIELDEASQNGIRAAAFAAGLDPHQTALLTRQYADAAKTAQDEMARAVEAENQAHIDSLRKEFGSAFDENVELYRSAVRKFGGDELKQLLETSGMANHPVMVKAMSKIGKMLASDEIHGEGAGRKFAFTPADAQAQWARLKASGDFQKSLIDTNHPKHAENSELKRQLFESMYPNE